MAKLDAPRQAVMGVDGLLESDAAIVANRATWLCRQYLPKVTGAAAASVTALFGPGWFGVEWTHDSVWFMESGTHPHTMRSLAGKVVPMWINDPEGKERAKSPKAKTRTTADGRDQTLIFRRCATPGARKNVWRNEGGRMVRVSVPQSYPGAPGRIAVNRSQGLIRAGDLNPRARNPGWIAPRNVGVRWRHPGLDAGRHIVRGIADAAIEFSIPIGKVAYLPESTVAVGSAYDIVLARR
jgi:hypothetical protein